MKAENLDDGESLEDLTEKQRSIIETAIENPAASHEEIADEANASASYVSNVHNKYINEIVQPELATPSDINDDLYESIVAGIEAMNEVTCVEKKHDLELSQGDSKEVDVAAWIERGGHEFLIIVECKFHEDRIEQEVVSGMARNVQNSAANKAVLVSKRGFQSGAISQARDAGIELYTLRELEEGDLDGRVAKVNLNIEYAPRVSEIVGLELSPLNHEPPEGKNLTPHVNRNPELYTSEKTRAGETVFDRLEAATIGKSLGTHIEEIKNRLMLLDGEFYQMSAIEFEVREQDRVEWSDTIVNAYEEYDLFMLDELASEGEDIDLYSIEDALKAFVANVEQT